MCIKQKHNKHIPQDDLGKLSLGYMGCSFCHTQYAFPKCLASMKDVSFTGN